MNKIILKFGYKSFSAQCRESTKFEIFRPTSLSSCHFTHHRSYSDCEPCVDGKSGKASAIIFSWSLDNASGFFNITDGTNLEANALSMLCLGLKRSSSPWIISSRNGMKTDCPDILEAPSYPYPLNTRVFTRKFQITSASVPPVQNQRIFLQRYYWMRCIANELSSAPWWKDQWFRQLEHCSILIILHFLLLDPSCNRINQSINQSITQSNELLLGCFTYHRGILAAATSRCLHNISFPLNKLYFNCAIKFPCWGRLLISRYNAPSSRCPRRAKFCLP